MIELELTQFRQLGPGHRHSIDHGKIGLYRKIGSLLPYKTRIKTCIMSYQRASFAKLKKFRKLLGNKRGILYHGIGYRGKLGYPVGYRFPGINKGRKPVCNLTFYNLNRPYFYDIIPLRIKTGCLSIKNNKGIIKSLALTVYNDAHGIIHKISFQSVNKLKIRMFLLYLGQLMEGIRKGLDNTVVRNGQGLVSPGCCTLHKRPDIAHAVHVAHLGMTMKLDPLNLLIIRTDILLPAFSLLDALYIPK